MIFLDKFLQGLKPQFDDDVVDRLNYYYTPMMLIIFALTLSAKQYVGQPIQCWPPAQFTGAWEQYSENYCFVKNTYFLPLNHYIPQDLEERETREIGYYQWVPFVLGIQGILFYLPSLIWRILNWQSGVAVKGIIQMCEDVGNMQVDKRKSSVEVVATHLRDSLKVQRNLARRFILSPLLARGSYLTILYLLVKFVYLAQVLMQFVILNNFLGTNYTFWGSRSYAIWLMVRNGKKCVLMINMFNEKIYLFVWWWFLVVAIATLANLIYWLSLSLSSSQQESFITQYLRVYHLLSKDDINEHEAVSKFVHHHLRSDGVFLLRLVSMNAGDLITTDIVYSLWHQFLTDEAAAGQTLPLRASKNGLEDVDGFEDNLRSRD
uniref:Innexin n=1 Tax=Ditylenchus dipsaci TaxID=166011 RepID=A0A915DGQ5_9BILA